MPAARGFDSGVQTAAAPSGYATGPYGTGGTGSDSTQTQQGFYRTSTPDNGGPVASTADARSLSRLHAAQATAPMCPVRDTLRRPWAVHRAYAADDHAADRQLCAPVTTPVTDYDYPASVANSGYPSTPPTAGYPATAAGLNYPATNSAPLAPATYGATPYAAGPPSYGDAVPTYGAASQYGPYAAAPAAPGSAYSSGTSSAYGAGTGTAPVRPARPAGIGRAAPAATAAT